MEKNDIINKLNNFKSNLEFYINEINKLEDYEKPFSYKNLKELSKNLNTELTDLEDYIFKYGKLSTTNFVTIDGDNGNVYFASLSNLYVYNLKHALDKVEQDLIYVISNINKTFPTKKKNISDEDFLIKIKRIKEIMIEYSCGGYYLDYEENGTKNKIGKEYKILYIEISDELTSRGLINNNIYKNLINFYEFYKDKLSKYAERRLFINNLYQDILDDLELLKIRDELKNDDILNNLVVSDETQGDEEYITNLIKHSKVKFFSNSSNIQDKRDAIKNLADCLEHYKGFIQSEYLVDKDESDLFNIANNYGIRHLNKNKQKLSFDNNIFYEWIFLTYYNNLKLIINLINRKND